MKRIIFEILLIAALAGAGTFAFVTYKKGSASASELTALSEQNEAASKKLEELGAELEKLQKDMPPLQAKALQLDALRESLAHGQTLGDVEAAYKKEKSLSPERQAGLGALRMLTRGGNDPAAIEAYKKALDSADWGSRRKLICAAQKALASVGQEVKVLSECLPEGVEAMPVNGPTKAEKKAEETKDSKPAPEDKAAKDDKQTQDASLKGEPTKGELTKAKASAAEERLAAAAKTAADAKPAKPELQWSYEGENGPENWGKSFAMCGRGRLQAPLDIRAPYEKVRTNLMVDYKPGSLRLVNTGTTIEVHVPQGSRLRIDSMPYDLQYFHFHRPSEELVDGRPSAMGVRFVHRNKEGKVAVLGVLLREGNENPGIKTLWDSLPRQKGAEVELSSVNFNPANLLPRELDFWSYDGSLTTPPCNEGIKYFIFKSPVNIAREQVAQFPFKRNARPVQPQYDRTIQSS